MLNQIKFLLLISFVVTITACGSMGELVPVDESQDDSIEETTSS